MNRLISFVETAFVHNDPRSGCLAVYHELKGTEEQGDGVDKTEILKQFKAIRAMSGVGQPISSAPPSWSGTGGSWFPPPGAQPVALASAFNAVAPFGQTQQISVPAQPPSPGGHGYYGPQQQYRGGGGFVGGRSRGRGTRGGRSFRGGRVPGRGQGNPMCWKCSQAGQSANHSRFDCPLNQCYKCGGWGHIRENCTN